jgi:acyl-CoA dehydrogenase
MIYRVAKEKDLGQSLPIESSVAKLFTSEIGEDVARDTIQIFGGYGFMKEFHVERFYRDVKLATIGGGTSEIQRSIIASSFPGTEEFLQKLKSINLYLGNRESYVHRGAGELDRLQTPDYPKMEEERKSKEGKEGNLEEFAQDPDFKKLIFLIREILYELPSGFRKENQSQEFAFSDLLMTLLVIDSVLQGLPEAVSWYTNDQKARDFKLLIRLIIGKYIHSFIELAGKSDSAALVLESLKDFANSESEIQESMQFLESRFHHPALNGKEVLI